MKTTILISAVMGLAGCASIGSAPFVANGKATRIPDNLVQDIAGRRANQKFPVPFATKVPLRAQPLVVDFAIMLSHPDRAECPSYSVSMVEPGEVAGSEIWRVSGCGTARQFKVAFRRCNDLLNASIVSVSRVPFDGHVLEGKDPLDSSFLVACPDGK